MRKSLIWKVSLIVLLPILCVVIGYQIRHIIYPIDFSSENYHSPDAKIRALRDKLHTEMVTPIEDTIFTMHINDQYFPATSVSRIGLKMQPKYVDRWLKDYKKSEERPDYVKAFSPLVIPWDCKSMPEYYSWPGYDAKAILFRKEGVLFFLYDR